MNILSLCLSSKFSVGRERDGDFQRSESFRHRLQLNRFIPCFRFASLTSTASLADDAHPLNNE